MSDLRKRRIGATVFDSDTLAGDDDARFAQYHALFESMVCATDMSRDPNLPFLVRQSFARIGVLGFGGYEGTLDRVNRGQMSIAHDADDDFCVLINRGGGRVHSRQANREHTMEPRAVVLLTNGSPAEMRIDGRAAWTGIKVPRKRLKATATAAEDSLARPLQRDALGQLLGRYVESVLDLDESQLDTALTQHVETTVVDLLALMLGAKGDDARLATGRGLRAARLQEILALIGQHFAEPDFSSLDTAARLGVSQRYVNRLLFETGLTFAERVLALRLDRARAMLSDVRYDRMKISEIAFTSGFNDVSYFNRQFRARFGTSPTQYRGGGTL